MAVGCGPSLAKILLIIFNIFFWLSGAALLGVGIWLLVDNNGLQHITVINIAIDGPLLTYSAYVLIAVGSLVLIVGFFGCCGAIKENRCMLGVYICFLVIIMALEIAAGVLAFIYRDNIEDEIGNKLKEAFLKNYGNDTKQGEAFTDGLNVIQTQFECCGINGKSDYLELVPQIAPPGCLTSVEDWIKEKSVIFIAVGIGIACLELFGFIFAVCLCRNVGEDD